MIDDEFWEKKIELEFGKIDYIIRYWPINFKTYIVKGGDDPIGDSRLKYVKLLTQEGIIVKGSEFFMPKSECIDALKSKSNYNPLIDYFKNCKERYEFKLREKESCMCGQCDC